MRVRTLTAVTLGLIASSTAVADTPTTVDEAIAAVEAKYTDVSALQASFTQTVRNPIFGDDVQTGEVTLARPTKMHWSFGGGEREFVTDGSTMWIYTKADNQVIQYDSFAPSAGGAESLLTSLDTIDEVFNVDLVSSNPTVLDLTPKEEGQFKSVTLTLDADLLVDVLSIVDPFDNTTLIDFDGMVLNGPAPDSLFTFDIPEGANVVNAGSL